MKIGVFLLMTIYRRNIMKNTKQTKNTKYIDKNQFIKKLSERSGYTLTDSKYFLDILCDVLIECVIDRTPLKVRGFGELNFYPIAKHVGFNPKKLEKIELPDSEKVIFTLAQKIRKPYLTDEGE
jgi:nucleoid DNA-binding protein